MYPTYRYLNPSTFRLSADDIRNIQSLYGKLNLICHSMPHTHEKSHVYIWETLLSHFEAYVHARCELGVTEPSSFSLTFKVIFNSGTTA